MIHALSGIDQHASSGATLWHRASALSKLLLAAVLVGLAVSAPSVALLAALLAIAWTLGASARIPVKLLAAAASYPLMIAALFVITAWDGTWATPARIALRPLSASLTAVWLVGTTPYPDLFAPLSRVLPRSIGDGLFVTYRALFELLERGGRLWRAFRVRGATRLPVRQRLELAGQGLGTLVLYGFERSQRLYATMLLRGHQGRICGCRHYAEMTRADLGVAAAGVVTIGAALALWRLW